MSDSTSNWHELTAEADIAELMNRFGHFHDACVRELHVNTGHFVRENLSMSIGWIAARHVSWRDASEWMGPNLRYRVEH